MSDLLVSASFTKDAGDVATGLTLADIELYLTCVDRGTGVETVIWPLAGPVTVNPTSEIDDMGAYIRIYTDADPLQNVYFGRADYVGATVLDQTTVTGVTTCCNIPIGSAEEFTYTLTSSVDSTPIEGATIEISTDVARLNIIWRGQTDAFGIARDDFLNLPLLDPGIYQFWRIKSGWTFDNPDQEEVNC